MAETILILNDLSKKILIADDMSLLKAVSLVAANFASVTAVSSGHKAIEILKNQDFDLVITDYNMKFGDGIELIDFIKNNAKRCLVIMITGFGTKDLVMKGINSQIFSFIEKPIDQSTIEAQIIAALKEKEMDENLRLDLLLDSMVETISIPVKELDEKVLELSRLKQGSLNINNQDTYKEIQFSLNKIKEIIKK